MKAMILAAMLIPAVAAAQVPGAMSFQGRLLKSDGSAETGTPKITFRIYDAGSGGNEKWSEEQDVKLTNGFYAVLLGSVKPFPADLFDGGVRWLGVQVAGDSEMVPRQFIATVPYAFKAAKAEVATSAAALSSGGSGIVANGERIQNVATPTVASDAATKGYVDTARVASAAAATALATNGTNCAAGQAALGVDAAGNAEGCWTPASNALSDGTSGIVWATGWTSRSGTSLVKTSTGLVIGYLELTFANTNTDFSVLVGKLPAGYRPAVSQSFTGFMDQPTDSHYRFMVAPDGSVYAVLKDANQYKVSFVFVAGN